MIAPTECLECNAGKPLAVCAGAGEPAHTDARCLRGSAASWSAASGECEMLHSSERATSVLPSV